MPPNHYEVESSELKVNLTLSYPSSTYAASSKRKIRMSVAVSTHFGPIPIKVASSHVDFALSDHLLGSIAVNGRHNRGKDAPPKEALLASSENVTKVSVSVEDPFHYLKVCVFRSSPSSL